MAGTDDQPIVITRDELLSVWREQRPGACSCPPGRTDSSCPRHGRAIKAARAEFLAASVAVWREIDRLDAEPGGYHPVSMSAGLRQRERAAWAAYRALLDPGPVRT